MPSVSSCALSVVLAAVGYIYYLCITSPNRATSPYQTDRIRFLTSQFTAALSNIVTITLFYQAVVTLFYDNIDRDAMNWICRQPNHLRDERFSWNERTVGCLVIFTIGAWIRLSAYGRLGRNFTFALAVPDHLVTSGLYRFMQHPSYTGLILVIAGCLGLVVGQWDTALACWIPVSVLGMLQQWQTWLNIIGMLFGLVIMRIRVRDEERMLKGEFGREWEDWHSRTARFIPTIF
ncbi:hypothetical protein BJX68DRAFT_257304 [Aspergillus pseudodeflectus]|uniref:Protein-S-isoprenylcysteine O-methyltransferase n=1 Tax=Aspergillus pseudodeflectus TaxID=176178 RepID=A0ABR4JVH9_9EURO